MKVSWRRFFGRRQNLLALTILLVMAAVAVAAPRLAPQDPENPMPFKRVGERFDRLPRPPSAENPLGSVPFRLDAAIPGVIVGDETFPQLDIYYTLIWGTRSAFRFGLTVTLLTASFGILVGAISGYAGGAINGVLMRMTDAFLGFPAIAAVWLFQRSIFSGAQINPFGLPVELRPLEIFLSGLGIDAIMLALIFFSWMPYARVINALVIQLKQVEYVTAARSMGASGARILFRHLLPNAISPAIILAARDVGGLVILETAFTFIGLGGSSAWGVLLVAGRNFIIGLSGNPLTYWWTFLPVSLALVFFGLAWNMLGDGLNTELNPRKRGE
jgi:peptide/nickel transport system permease protein